MRNAAALHGLDQHQTINREQAHVQLSVSSHTQDVRRLFDDRSANWSSKYAAGEPLERRLARFAAPLASLVPPPAKVLDLGCGTGNLSRHLVAGGYHVVGVDVSSAMLDVARKSGGSATIEWAQLDADPFALPCLSESCGAVVASSVLEYVDDPAAVMRECARVLRPTGVLLCTVPDPAHLTRRVEAVSRLLARYGSLANRGGLPRLSAYLDYLRLSKNRFRLEQWRLLAHDAGLESVALAPDDGHPALALLAFTRPANATAHA